MSHDTDADAIIIGSGPNGLAAAIRLAQRGLKPLVLESGPTPGGGMRTKELTLPGFHHDVCSAVHPMGLASPYLKTLPLHEHGLHWLHPQIPLAHPLDDGRAGVLHQSIDATCDAFGPTDGPRYRRFFEYLVNHSSDLYSDLLRPFSIPRHPFTVSRMGIGAALPATWFAHYFSTAEARALFAGNAAHSVLPLSAPLSSAIGLVLQVSAHAVGWPQAQGGSQSIANAMISLLKSLGGEVRCNVHVKSWKELPEAKAWLFDISPKNLASICADILPASYLRKLNAYRHGPGVFKVDYALSAPIPWKNADSRKAGTVHVGGTLEEIAASEKAAFTGQHTDKPFVLVSQPCVADPTRAPEGKHIAWAYCHVPNGSTQDMREIIDSQIERFAPGFKDTILSAATLNTEQVEAYNPNYIGGDIIGGITDWRQLFTRPAGLINPHATPNPKVYLCSASTPPGGGVHGMCGYWAAENVMRKLGK